MKKLTATTFFLTLRLGWMFGLAVLSARADQFKANIGISFPTQPGYGYQVEYKTNLTGAAWIPSGNLISGDGAIQSVNDGTGAGGHFYRVRIQ